jgi:SAM-dependent methyltransferase
MRIHYDLPGMALNDYFQGNRNARIKVHSPDFEEDEIDVSWYFRSYDDMPAIEKKALDLSRGRILDAGAGAGSHALYLQRQGKEVDALDISGGACEIMRRRGLKNVYEGDIFSFKDKKYDTLLMMMNGIGILGTIEGLQSFLDTLPDILSPDGQFIFDSSNLMFLYEDERGEVRIDLGADYFGQVSFRLEYDDFFTKQFDWLYIDFDTLSWMAEDRGFRTEFLMEGENHHYLARILL